MYVRGCVCGVLISGSMLSYGSDLCMPYVYVCVECASLVLCHSFAYVLCCVLVDCCALAAHCEIALERLYKVVQMDGWVSVCNGRYVSRCTYTIVNRRMINGKGEIPLQTNDDTNLIVMSGTDCRVTPAPPLCRHDSIDRSSVRKEVGHER